MSHYVTESTPHCRSPTLLELFNHAIDVPHKTHNDESLIEVLDHTPSNIPFVLSFNNLTYVVKLGRKIPIPWAFHNHQRVCATTMTPPLTRSSPPSLSKAKMILNDVSGEARGGEILSVLGSSGSGKTTLIDALANRITKENIQGTITLNGERLESRLLKSISGYVMQDDLLYPMLTVKETLMFASEFNLPDSLSRQEKKERVEGLIKQLGLEHVTKTIIGDEGHRGVSGGERRRVSIGIEIISQPLILFLDEPTSGLDSTNAYMVMKVVQRVAQSGSIVITSIHQPSNRILGLIDRVVLLSHGQTIYSGTSINLASFFQDLGYPLAENENWAEFAIDLIQDLQDSGEGVQAMVDFNISYLKLNESKFVLETNPLEGSSLTKAINLKKSSQTSVEGRFANPFLREVGILSRRLLTNLLRIPEAFGVFFFIVTFTAVLLAATFWQLDNTPKAVVERCGFYLYSLMIISYSCGEALPSLIAERYIFNRETANNTYRHSSYVAAQALVSIPGLIIVSISFGTVSFWTVGLGGGISGFFFYILIVLATFWAGNSYVVFLSSIVRENVMGSILMIGGISYYHLYAGFFVTPNSIPRFMLWFYHMSMLNYTYQAMLLNEFQDPFKCFARGGEIFDNTVLSVVPENVKEMALLNFSRTARMNITSGTCLTTGADVLKHQDIYEMNKWEALLIVVGYGIFFRVLFYMSLLLGSKNKRK